MRTARLGLAVFVCLALTPGAGYADKQAPLKPPQSVHKGAAKAKPFPQLRKPAANRGRGSAGPFPTAKGAAIQKPVAGGSRPGPPKPAPPMLSNVRHHSPNPAVISGSTNLSMRNTGAIDGRQIHRQP